MFNEFETDEYPASPANRADRRRAHRAAAGNPFENITAVLAGVHDVERAFNDDRRETGFTSVPDTIYRGGSVMPRYLSWQRLHCQLAKYKPPTTKEKQILERVDMYGRLVNGVSLKEIEKIDLPLDVEGFVKTGKLFHRRKILGLIPRSIHPLDHDVMNAVPILATQPHAQKDVKSPKDLQPLIQRAQEYFDFGLPYFTDPHTDQAEEDAYLNYVVFSSILTYSHFLTYIPARLGILPQTAFEMYLAKSKIGLNAKVWKAMNFGKKVEKILQNAHPDGTLDSDVVDLGLQSSTNRISAQKLSEIYSSQRGNPQAADKVVDEFGDYRKKLVADIRSARQGAVVIPTESDDIAEMIVTAHNNSAAPSYRGSLIISVRPRGVEKPVIVELDRKARLYGVPMELIAKNPHAEMVLKTALLDKIVRFCTDTYATKGTKEVDFEPIRLDPLKPVIISDTVIEAKEKVKTRGKAREEDVTERPAESSQQAAFVDYDLSVLQAMMGNMKDQTQVNRVVDRLSRFELTGDGIYVLEIARRLGADLYGLRSGDHRLILSGSGGNFKVEDVLTRSQYNNKGLELAVEKYIRSKNNSQ